jgi:hypothetical protein
MAFHFTSDVDKYGTGQDVAVLSPQSQPVFNSRQQEVQEDGGLQSLSVLHLGMRSTDTTLRAMHAQTSLHRKCNISRKQEQFYANRRVAVCVGLLVSTKLRRNAWVHPALLVNARKCAVRSDAAKHTL